MTEQVLEQEQLAGGSRKLADLFDVAELCVSGEWREMLHMDDYRAEQVGDLFVERATWGRDTPDHALQNRIVVAAGHVWLRFWMLSSDQVIEKYYDADGRTLGIFAPICMPIERDEDNLHARSLLLALWIAPDGRIGVLNEALFDRSVQNGHLSVTDSEYAELRIRKLTMAISERQFPPALIRNFELDLSESEDDRNP